MKKRFYYITTIMLSAAALSLSSCLKDDSHFVNFAGAGATVELPIDAYHSGAPVAEALPISATPQAIPLIINVASPNPLTTSVGVTLALDAPAVAAYDNSVETPYKADSLTDVQTGVTPPAPPALYRILPAADYSVDNWTVTVPANQREATLNINVKTNLIDPSQVYMLPIKIASASGQTINQFNEVLFLVQVKNKWDGQYTVTGTLTDAASSAITGAYPNTVDLETLSGTTDIYFDTTQGNFHEINNGGQVGVYGAFDPIFTFDPTTNKITAVVNFYGQPDPSRLRAAQLDPSGVNGFTSGTPGAAGSVFKVKYIMTMAGAPRTTFDETWTYKGTR